MTDDAKGYHKVSEALYFLIFAFSISIISLQVLMTDIIDNFSLTGSTQAMLPSMFLLGGTFSVLLMPFMKGRISKAFTMAVSSCVMTGLMALIGFSPSLIWAATLCLLLGLFAGWVDSYTNSSIVDIHKVNSRKYVGYLHASFCIGAMGLPMLIHFLMKMGFDWRKVCFVSALIMGLIAFKFIRTTSQNKDQINADSAEPKLSFKEIKTFAKDKFYIAMVLCYSFFCLSQNGVSIWLFHYTRTVHPNVEILASFIVSAFWLGSFISRLVYYRIKVNTMKLFICGITISIAAHITGILSNSPVLFLIMIFVMSLSSGFGFPSLVNETLTHYRGNTTMALTGLHFGGKLGAFIMPLIMGAVAVFNIHLAMLINDIAAAVAIASALAAIYLMKKSTNNMLGRIKPIKVGA
ncbi:MAG: MFS transporter [Elusimicrobiota bacterium]|jgi:MFS family permease|nr:MFS transporter [Elusimicrobiota bacterium]